MFVTLVFSVTFSELLLVSVVIRSVTDLLIVAVFVLLVLISRFSEKLLLTVVLNIVRDWFIAVFRWMLLKLIGLGVVEFFVKW